MEEKFVKSPNYVAVLAILNAMIRRVSEIATQAQLNEQPHNPKAKKATA